jgi:S1-C subfamily serine protease
LSKKFHAAPRVFKSPDRPGGSVGVIVTWGGIELRALGQDDLATIAQGRSANRGILVDYLMDPKKSARVGFPVYGLAGGAGFVWIAGADERGEGHLRFFAADPSAMTHFEPAALETPQEVARPAEPVQPSRPPAAAAEPPKEKQSSSGTGFFVSSDGHIVTNAHVVTDCAKPQIVAGLAPPVVGRVLARDVANDLALLKGDLKPAGVATLRAGARIGEQIGIFGYPLVGLLSTKGNFTEGNVSAVAGMRDDTRFLQISAPVQPGNSGGPALDQSGNVIGVVVAKLDAIKVAAAIQDVPQNVNFAIKTTVLINFLDSNGVSYATGVVGATLPAADLAERGKSISALIVCEQ